MKEALIESAKDSVGISFFIRVIDKCVSLAVAITINDQSIGYAVIVRIHLSSVKFAITLFLYPIEIIHSVAIGVLQTY